MLSRIVLCLILAAVLGGCGRAPQPTSELGRKIYGLMLQYEAVGGPIDLYDELCDGVDEESLRGAVEEMPELNASFNLVDVRSPVTPSGATAASFSRPVDWFFKTQTLHLVVKSDEGFCDALLWARSL